MVEKKYNELVLLVHPLWATFTDVDFNFELIIKGMKDINSLTESELKEYKFKKSRLDKRIKIILGVYGNTLLKYKNKPNTAILLFESFLKEDQINREYSKDMNKQIYSLYSTTINRFVKFCKTNFGDRFSISEYSSFSTSNGIFSRNKIMEQGFISKIKPDVDLIGFGEYLHLKLCINGWLSNVTDRLLENHIKVHSSTILVDSSLSHLNYTANNSTGYRKRLLKFGISKSERKEFNDCEKNPKVLNKKFNLKKGHKSMVK